MDWSAIGLSLRLAGATTLVLLALGLPLAHWLAHTHFRWRFLIEAVVGLPLVLPPTVLGFYVLMAISPMSPLGRSYEWLVGHRLPFTFEGLLIGSVLYSLPFAVQPFAAAFRAVDSRMLEASWCLGVGTVGTFFRVLLPLAWHGVITGAVLSFAHTVGEFGVVLMVGGDIPGVTRTASISIYDQVQALNYGAAHSTSLVLLLFALAVLALAYGLQHRFVQLWPMR